MKRHGCGAEHPDELAEVRCNYLELVLDRLREYATRLDRPPTTAQVDDLWSHARELHDDGHAAARWARQVLDLGWRPTVGVR